MHNRHSENGVFHMLREIGAVLTGDHFRFTSGRHSDTYIAHKVIYAHPRVVSELGLALVERFSLQNTHLCSYIDTIVVPDGAIALGVMTAFHLFQEAGKQNVFLVWGTKERDELGRKKFSFDPAFIKFILGKNLLLVDDTLTTGSTHRALIEACSRHGGNITGCACIWNRGGVTSDQLYRLPLISIINEKLKDWGGECPLCKAKIPINTQHGWVKS